MIIEGASEGTMNILAYYISICFFKKASEVLAILRDCTIEETIYQSETNWLQIAARIVSHLVPETWYINTKCTHKYIFG